MKRTLFFCLIAIYLVLVFAHLDSTAYADPVPTTIDDFFLPGSQPLESGTFRLPGQCDNCHGGYDLHAEPAFNWRGSMMSQAMRDPLYLANLAVSNQDAPESGDLCIRCHSPVGWLEGRSEPTDGSALVASDRESVQCHFCHKLVKPIPIGVNPYPGDPDYTAGTYPRDTTYFASMSAHTDISADGMFICDSDDARRGPFVDANANHAMYYSPFHSDANICGTCHDVSSPVFDRQPDNDYVPNAFGQPATGFSPYDILPVERTFSEWLMSDYNTPSGVYAPQFGGNKDSVATCQDCHMKDVTGKGADRNNVPIRPDMPQHDLTGGNTWVPNLIESVYPGEADLVALDSGIVRATYMLRNAATMSLSAAPQGGNQLLTVTLTNETGHKLPSGYPEGRRMWINVQAYDINDSLIYESATYDYATGELGHDPEAKIYEIKPGISPGLSTVVNIPAGPSFHFVLNDTVYKDNRIPPRGFTNENFLAIQSPPVGYSYPDGQYWDDTEYLLPGNTHRAYATLYYQTTSKEFIEFLRDENTTTAHGDTMYSLWVANDRCPPEEMVSQSYIFPIGSNVPQAVDDLVITRSEPDIILTWSPVTQDTSGFPLVVDYYRIYRDTNAGFVPSGVSLIDSTLSTTYTDTSILIVPNPMYFYRVSAVVEE